MAIRTETIDTVMRKRGYSVITETKKKRCFQMNSGTPVYLNIASASGTTALVLHPHVACIDALRRIPGVTIGDENSHASNMRRFPKRIWKGKKETPYVWGVTFDSEAALDKLSEIKR